MLDFKCLTGCFGTFHVRSDLPCLPSLSVQAASFVSSRQRVFVSQVGYYYRILTFLCISQLDSELLYAPGFFSPPNLDYKGYHLYIDEVLPPESPSLYGLHPNAEVGILTVTSDELFRTVLEMQPRESGEGSEGIASMDETVGWFLLLSL